MKYLITGGAGFIGSNIVERLINDNEYVRVIDDFSTGKKGNLETFEGRYELVQADIREFNVVREAVEGIDVVFHEAALPSVQRSIIDPISSNEVNITGTLNVLWASKEAGVKRVVYASSSSVYGDTPELPKHEGMPTNPLSPYAVSKLAAEKYLGVFARLYGIETVALRYFNVFGPRQDPTSQYSAVIPKFITSMLKDERPIIYGDGEQSRDFTYIDNVVGANLLAASRPITEPLVLNCATQHRVTLNELVHHINSLLGKDLKPIYAEPRRGDIKHSLAATARINNALGYEPHVGFLEGLKKTIDGFNSKC